VAGDSDALAVRDLENQVTSARLAALARRAEAVSQIELDKLLSERQARLKSLARRSPHIAELMAVTEPDIADIQAALGANSTLLYALPLSFTDTVRWLVVQPQSLALREGNMTGRELGQLLNRFIQAGLQDRSNDQADGLSRIVAGLSLSDLPAVVPSGPLYRVPWGAPSHIGRSRCCPRLPCCRGCMPHMWRDAAQSSSATPISIILCHPCRGHAKKPAGSVRCTGFHPS
jgi:hypothetical protein